VSHWKEPPPVVVLSGTHDYLRTRELKEAVAVADDVGRTIEHVQGDDREEISRILSSTGVFFQEDALVVVENPEKVDADLVLRHFESEDNSVVLVLHQEGHFKAKGPLGKITKVLPDRFVAKFDKPKPWEEDEHATQFCVSEARRRKLKIEDRLAAAIVQNVGSDLGMLAFEVQKLALLLSHEGETAVAPAHIKQTIAAFGELGPRPVVDALERRDLSGVARALANMRRTHAGNLGGATLRACAFVGSSARNWLHVAALMARKTPQDQIPDRVKLHPFVVRKTLVPVARRWGEGRLTSLVKSIALVERSVRSGHVSPWVQLECALFRSFHGGLAG
jgi:DNA polymerase III delta subunit